MKIERGVTCPRCGASTPLPHDLRAPSFACAYCHATLETAAFAGGAAVTADALLGHMRAAVAAPEGALASIAQAPRFEDENTETRDARCRHCQAPVAVPMNLRVHTLTCGSCGRAQAVSDYVSDRERLEADMARQIAGNEALTRLRAEGVACPRCGGQNAVPEGASVQFPCRFCGAAVLLADHADAGAVARQRLRDNVFALRDEMVAAQQRKDRRLLAAILAVVGCIAVAAVIANVALAR